MLYNLFVQYSHTSHIANVFTYISFRSVIATLISFIICFTLIPGFIKYFKQKQKYQPIRNDGPKAHLNKAGTPTMGGIVIIFSTIVSTLLLTDIKNLYIWIMILVFLLFGAVGFIDDYLKINKNNSRGISVKTKLTAQFLISFITFLLIQYVGTYGYETHLFLPFFKTISIDLGYFYFPFAMFVIIGSSNAVNLTDGLDGLAIGLFIISISAFALIAYIVGNNIYSNYLHILHITDTGELTVFCSALIGSSFAFLWYNANPAELFMGDVGSLSLGSVLGTISLITKHEIILSIIGGIFVIEAISVIIQVYYYKYTGGKRIFLMTPIHHHFEQKGWAESKVIIRFWIISIMLAIVGLLSLKIR